LGILLTEACASKTQKEFTMKYNTIIGIDLAKNVFQVCIATTQGQVKTNKTVTRGQLLEVITRQPPALIVMEACGGAHDWARRFRQVGHEVRLIAPQYVTPFRQGQKNDHNDAQALTEAGLRPGIPSVPIKTVEQQDTQALHRVRERLVKNRTALVNQIRGLLLEYGLVIPQGIYRLRKQLPRILEDAENGLTMDFRDVLESLSTELSDIDGRIAEATKRITRQSREREACRRLRTIDGVGPLSATALEAALGNGQCFETGRQVSAWLGLVPRQHSSGGKTRLGRITKRGNGYLRRLLIHGARSVVSRARGKADTQSLWIQQLVARVGLPRTYVAVANKIARVAWALLRTGESYRKPTTPPA
jgi:transposase